MPRATLTLHRIIHGNSWKALTLGAVIVGGVLYRNSTHHDQFDSQKMRSLSDFYFGSVRHSSHGPPSRTYSRSFSIGSIDSLWSTPDGIQEIGKIINHCSCDSTCLSSVLARAPSLSDLAKVLKIVSSQPNPDELVDSLAPHSFDGPLSITYLDMQSVVSELGEDWVLFFLLTHANSILTSGRINEVEALIRKVPSTKLVQHSKLFIRLVDKLQGGLSVQVIVPMLLEIVTSDNLPETSDLILRLLRNYPPIPQWHSQESFKKLYELLGQNLTLPARRALLGLLIEFADKKSFTKAIPEEIEKRLMRDYFKPSVDPDLRELILAYLAIRPSPGILQILVAELEKQVGVSDYEQSERKKAEEQTFSRPLVDSELYAFHDEAEVESDIDGSDRIQDEKSLFVRIAILTDIIRHKLSQREGAPGGDLKRSAALLMGMTFPQIAALVPHLNEKTARQAMRALANISTLGRFVTVDARNRFLDIGKSFAVEFPEPASVHTKAELLRLIHNLRCLPIRSAPMLIDSFLPLSSTTPSDSEVDFVFIHGLRGGLKTWRTIGGSVGKKVQLWPSVCLSDHFPSVRLLAFTYEAPLWYATHKQHYSEIDVKRNFDEMAISLRSALSDAGVGRNGKKVVFITFSMGGLVAKRALVDDELLRENTLGVVFFATPHLGSPIADYAYYTSVGGFIVSPFVEDLSRKSKQVLSLHEAYMNNCKDIRNFSVCETAETDIGAGLKATVVPLESCMACNENPHSTSMLAGNKIDHEAVPKIPADLMCEDARVVALIEFLNTIIAPKA